MAAGRINPKNLRERCKAKNLTVVALAKRIGKTRQAVYFAAENPRRFSRTYRLMEAVLS
jgi:hypothetical protein